jgi:hypothetical protein
MTTSDPTAANFSPGTYTPGNSKRKLFMVFYGLLLVILGMTQLWEPLRLLVFGQRAEAEVIDVIKTKEGLPDLILSNDLQLQNNLEPNDRSYVFWNEFQFHAADGRVVNVRATVGGQLKPLYTLLDTDGLPTTDLVCYDPAHPETVVFPLIISTWFAPGMLVIIGLAVMIIGSVLYYWANKPIELPHITPAP